MRVSLVTCVLAAFLAAYLLFFVYPTFSGPVMRSVRSVPAQGVIGGDLDMVRTFSESWLNGHSPYTGLNIYPPLTAALFTPLLLVSGAAGFKVMTVVTIAGFILMTLVLPIRLRRGAALAILPILVTACGLVSYGFQLELERGQFNVISVMLCYLAIWVFHRAPARRPLAYALFVVAVQLKVYPLIFMLMLVDDWRDWAGILKRWAWLGAANVALLFALGPAVFTDFLAAMTQHVQEPSAWTGNHSIRSYLLQLPAAHEHIALLEAAATLLTAVCLGLVVLKAIARNTRGINGELLLACTLAALLIPPISHDYKLALLAAPLAVMLADDGESWRARAGTESRFRLAMALAFALAFAYASTLLSYDYRPGVIDNAEPIVMSMLLLTAALSLTLDSATARAGASSRRVR